MVKLSYIIKKYDIIDKDLEIEFHTDKYAIVCEPDYRYNCRAKSQVRCYDIGELNSGIRVPMFYRSIVHTITLKTILT